MAQNEIETHCRCQNGKRQDIKGCDVTAKGEEQAP